MVKSWWRLVIFAIIIFATGFWVGTQRPYFARSEQDNWLRVTKVVDDKWAMEYSIYTGPGTPMFNRWVPAPKGVGESGK